MLNSIQPQTIITTGNGSRPLNTPLPGIATILEKSPFAASIAAKKHPPSIDIMPKEFEFPFMLKSQKMDKAVQTEPMRHEVQRQSSLVFEAVKSIQSDKADDF